MKKVTVGLICILLLSGTTIKDYKSFEINQDEFIKVDAVNQKVQELDSLLLELNKITNEIHN